MQKFDLHETARKGTLTAVVIVMYFAVLVLFSYWFTHS